jgi:hypothetical protein
LVLSSFEQAIKNNSTIMVAEILLCIVGGLLIKRINT